MKTDRIRQIMQETFKAAQEEKEETANAVNEVLDKPSASIALAIQMLSRRPDISISTLIRSASLYKNNDIMDEKTAELIAISSAVANRCEHCMSVHLDKAVSLGATEEEIFNTILISSAICETSAWAYGFREFRKLEGKLKQKRRKNNRKSTP